MITPRPVYNGPVYNGARVRERLAPDRIPLLVFAKKKDNLGSYRVPIGHHFDKDKASVTKIKNLHETSQIMSYRPEN